MEKNTKTEKVKRVMHAMIKHAWEHGTAAQALIEAGDYEMALLMAHEEVSRQTADGRLAGVAHATNITDPCVCGEPVMFAYTITGNEKYKNAAEEMLTYIRTAPQSKAGIQYHNTSEPMIAADCMYMVAPFYAVMGQYEEAVKQVDLRFNLLWNEEKRVMNHQWDDGKNCFWRDKCWGAASGWTAAAMVRVLSMLPACMSEEKTRLTGYLNKLVAGVLTYQLGNGLFHDILDEPDSFVETNHAQMMAYSIYRGVTEGLLDEKYIPAANRMRQAANDMVDEHGFVQGVAGAPSFDAFGVSPEGQAFHILMEVAAINYQKAVGTPASSSQAD